MGKKGFSATTFVLVAVLLGALFMVSKSVTPPPAAPPEPPKEPTAAPAKLPVEAKKGDDREDVMRKRMAQEMKQHQLAAGAKPEPKKFNPTTIEVTADYWKQTKMGAAGETEMRDKVEKAKAEMAAEAARRKAGQPIDKPHPTLGAPTPVEGSNAAPPVKAAATPEGH